MYEVGYEDLDFEVDLVGGTARVVGETPVIAYEHKDPPYEPTYYIEGYVNVEFYTDDEYFAGEMKAWFSAPIDKYGDFSVDPEFRDLLQETFDKLISTKEEIT